MPANNILFESGAFEGSDLILSYLNAPYEPGLVGRRQIFQMDGIETLKAAVEYRDDVLTLVPTSPRGGIGDLHSSAKRKMVEFDTAHIRTKATMMADSFQNVRGFGTTSLTSIEAERDRKIGEMKRRIGATLEYQWMRAFSGVVLDADGSELVNLLAEFGVTQAVLDMNLDVTTTNVRNRITAAKRLSEEALGAAVPSSWVCYCSASFIDGLSAHPSVEAALVGWGAAKAMRDDIRSDFDFANVQFIEAKNFGGVVAVEDGAAYLVPEGVPDLLLTRFSPADYLEEVNQIGKPAYVKAEPLQFNRGVMLEAQANPVSIVTRPRAVIKLTA